MTSHNTDLVGKEVFKGYAHFKFFSCSVEIGAGMRHRLEIYEQVLLKKLASALPLSRLHHDKGTCCLKVRVIAGAFAGLEVSYHSG
jgi:hypothetical protein